MTSLTRRFAGGITALEAVWLIYWTVYGPPIMITCPGNLCPAIPTLYLWTLLPLGVVVLIVGALGVWGASLAYPAGATLSAVALLITGYTIAVLAGYPSLSQLSSGVMADAALAAIAIIANVAGMRAKSGLSEQANPMNLPVFG